MQGQRLSSDVGNGALLQKSIFDENSPLKMAENRDPKMQKTVLFWFLQQSPKRATSDSAGLLVYLSCAGEGDTYNLTLRWKITPNGHLRETTKEKVVEYIRCKQ
jgi:hypothetical protein